MCWGMSPLSERVMTIIGKYKNGSNAVKEASVIRNVKHRMILTTIRILALR